MKSYACACALTKHHGDGDAPPLLPPKQQPHGYAHYGNSLAREQGTQWTTINVVPRAPVKRAAKTGWGLHPVGPPNQAELGSGPCQDSITVERDSRFNGSQSMRACPGFRRLGLCPSHMGISVGLVPPAPLIFAGPRFSKRLSKPFVPESPQTIISLSSTGP
jgi:hypothetical protein